MALYAPVSPSIPLAPVGTHLARCIRVVDLGSTYSELWKKYQRKVMITFELVNELIPEGERAGEPFAVSMFSTLSMHEKANLRKMLESWRGRKFTDDEAGKFDIMSLLGVSAFVNVAHETKNNKDYANILAIMPTPKGTEVPAPKSDVYGYSIDEHSDTTWEKISEKLRDRIMGSKEWGERQNPPPAETSGLGFDPNEDVPF